MINTALLKEQLKRFWGSSALLFACYILAIALPLYDRTGHGQLRSLASLLNMSNEYMTLSVLLAPLIATIVLFKFQNQVKSTTAMHTYPLTRNQILSTNVLAAMILLVLPLLAFCVIMIFPIHYFYHDLFISPNFVHLPIFPVNPQFGALPNSLLIMGRFFFITALSFLFYLSIYTLAATLSGNSIITLLLSAALPLLPIGLHMLATAICQFYVFGFHPRTNLDEFLVYMHPILFSLDRERVGYMLLRLVSYAAIIIVMGACCVFAVNKREQERADDSVVFPYIKTTLVFILSVCGLLLAGFIFLEMFLNFTAMYIGFVIGFFIAYCIAQMIAEKTFNIINKMKDFIKFGAAAIGLLILIIVSTRSDIFGYERYIPHFADVEGIHILDAHTLLRNRDMLTNTTLNEFLVKDQEIINETIALHQAIIDERRALRQFQLEHMHSFRIDAHYFSILYKLNNGNVIVRRYFLPESFIVEHDVRALQTRSKLSKSLLQNRPDLISNIDIFTRPHGKPEITISSHDHIIEFIEALTKDYAHINQPNTFDMNRVSLKIFFELEEFDFNIRMLESVFFETARGHRSYAYDWLIEKGYLF